MSDSLVSLDGVRVCLALPCYSGYVPLELATSLAKLSVDCMNYGVTLDVIGQRENGVITAVRNSLLSQYLEEHKEAEYLFWLDDDIIFTPDDFFNILVVAMKYKSAAATYTSRTDINPVFFIHAIHGNKPLKFTEDGLIEVKGVGLGFSCQHRSILEPLIVGKDQYKDRDGRTVYDVFKLGVVDGNYQGEDMCYFDQLYKNGHITYVHPAINLKHTGRKDYDHKLLSTIKEQ